MGHSSVDAAMRYLHATDDRQRHIVASLDDAIEAARRTDPSRRNAASE
jgi:hypothetical protein